MVSDRPSHLSASEHEQAAPRRSTGEQLWLGAGLLAAPLAWAGHLTISYGLVYPAADAQSKLSLYVASLVAGLLALLSLGVGLWGLRRGHLGRALDNAQRQRTTFLAWLAVMAGAVFLLAIVAQVVPASMLPLRGAP